MASERQNDKGGGFFRRLFSISGPAAEEPDGAEGGPEEPVIIRSARRRRVAFTIRPEDGRLSVLAPQRLSVAEIARIVASNAELVAKLKERFARTNARRTVPRFAEGGQFHYLGQLYPLRLTRRVLAFDDAFLVPEGEEEAIRGSLETIYRRLAEKLLEEKVPAFAARHGLTCGRVRVGGAKGRWGSCSRDGNLNFSWRLVRWPEPVVDYVIVHELAHRIELNHSDRFWREVERMCPGYREQDRFLRDRTPEYCPW